METTESMAACENVPYFEELPQEPCKKDTDSGLVKHAEKEMEILINSLPCDDNERDELRSEIKPLVISLMNRFSLQGHSGFSASYLLSFFNSERTTSEIKQNVMNLIKESESLEDIKSLESVEGENMDRWMMNNVLELVQVFEDYFNKNKDRLGEEKTSNIVSKSLGLFKTLGSYKPIAPLTGEDNEWIDVCEQFYQNNRCSTVFKDKETGKCYNMNGKIFREPDGCCFTSSDSKVYVTFPYIPKSEYVDVDFDR